MGLIDFDGSDSSPDPSTDFGWKLLETLNADGKLSTMEL